MTFEFNFVIDFDIKTFSVAFGSNNKDDDSSKILIMGFFNGYFGDNIEF